MTGESATTKRPPTRWASWELAALAELTKIMLEDHSLDQTLGRIAALACEAIGDITEVSVTMIDGDKATTVVFTGPLAVHLDERQYENGSGPCLDAAVTGQTIERAQVFANYAGVAVANAALDNHTAELADQMRAAMQSRSVIEQAKGILMERLGCDADNAFSYLSKLCQRSDRKLRDIAQWLVENPSFGQPGGERPSFQYGGLRHG
jgi:hypothetical protein